MNKIRRLREYLVNHVNLVNPVQGFWARLSLRM
jgi:hypothetical protein